MKKILIVDDSPLTQKQLKTILEESGHEVIAIAKNGVEAINLFNEKKSEIDMVTLDITMPMLDGITVLKNILQIKPDAKVVMVSAIGKEDTIRECISAGAKSFIVKPFNKEKIVEIINYVTG